MFELLSEFGYYVSAQHTVNLLTVSAACVAILIGILASFKG